jgi:hypothetical protein
VVSAQRKQALQKLDEEINKKMGFAEGKSLLNANGDPSITTLGDDEEEFQIEFKPSDI